MVHEVLVVAMSAPGGTLSTKGFSTVRIPPRNALRVVRSSSARNGSECCTKDGNSEES